ncbi:EAL domain-containing protein [Sporosarcina sp. FA9]|uniref:EAL domain-containing protein n=1 Tax=Sporosarcina sp. FA9 TaxID=3413030 RepID=UPI003F65AF73
MHYQPRVNLETGKIVGTEALIRWEHPGLVQIAPIHFISLAERTDEIIPIGNWVLYEVCRQNKVSS